MTNETFLDFVFQVRVGDVITTVEGSREEVTETSFIGPYVEIVTSHFGDTKTIRTRVRYPRDFKVLLTRYC